jgi:glycosyltransferase involved in cell wall biosynthesis
VRIAYVLPQPELNGGNKVIAQHASLLRDAGHQVRLLVEGPCPRWLASFGLDVHAEGAARPPAQDLVIATFWTTIRRALELEAGPVAHFCQGYEGGLAHLRGSVPEIEAAYRLPLPALVVSPHLGELLASRFGRSSRPAPPPVDPRFEPAWRLRPRARPWIAVPGIYEAEVKDVATALDAVAALRRSGLGARVLRYSLLPLGAAERKKLEPDRYLCAVPPAEVARHLRRCDLLLLPSRAEEGFGLPVLEAFASGVPVVASRIPSLLAFAAEAARLVPAGDAQAFADAAHELIGAGSWRRARRAGLRVAARFTPAAIAPLLLDSVAWAAEAARATTTAALAALRQPAKRWNAKDAVRPSLVAAASHEP